MIKLNHKVITATLLFAGITLNTQVNAQQWPQGEQAYMPSTQSPQWVDSKRNDMVNKNRGNPNMVPPRAMPYQQPPMHYPAPQYGYAPPPNMAPYAPAYGQPRFNQGYPPQFQQQPPYRGNTGWGSWPNNSNNNNFMPGMPNMGNWSMPNMNMGNWSTPDMPEMGNMPGMPNMDNFEMPSPSFDMPSPSFTTPNMNMPFNNQW